MTRKLQLCSLLAGVWALAAWAQVPTGSITGTITDPSGAVVPSVEVSVTNKGTSAVRTVNSGSDGQFSAPLLPAGVYEVKVAAPGFRTLVREATVETGGTTTVDLQMQVGATKDVVQVEAASAQVNYESHAIEGVITREKIQELPLNGRSFLNLAFLEPGVTVGTGSTSQYNSLFSVSVLGGSSGKTNLMVDGGNIRNAVDGNTSMNFSQEVVQEFQLASSNFDLSTGITSVGSVNVVTRSGSNDFHGSAYFFFRDHHMSAYPGIRRDPLIPEGQNPFFVRRNPGAWVGGPIIKNRLFFFTNYEYMNQVQAYSVSPNLASLAGLRGTYTSPYRAHLFSNRFDFRFNDKHTGFLRYSHDGNQGFGPAGGAQPPSNWLRNKNFSDQGVLGLTSAFTANFVNDFRFNLTYWQNRNLFPEASQCATCIGFDLPQVSFAGISGNVDLGHTSNATQGRDIRRFTIYNNSTWQHGSHRLRFGTELEYSPANGFWGFCDPGCLGVFSPEFIVANLGPLTNQFFPNMPRVVNSTADVLNLPIAGGVLGVGDPRQPPPYNLAQANNNRRMRFYAQDTWKIRPRLTLNYGLAWNYESTVVNRDLTKPAYLRPIIGGDGSPTKGNYLNFSPAVGFAWQADKSAKTVIRAGAGIYYDTESLSRRLQERAFIGPRGNGRIQYPYNNLINTIPGIIDVARTAATGQISIVPTGQPLPVNTITTMTLGQYLQLYRQQIPGIEATFNSQLSNPDLSVRNINYTKSGTDLYGTEFPVQRGLHMTVGVQRQIDRNTTIAVDFVRRVFTHVNIGGLDLNRFNRYINGVQTPVIPRCTGTQAADPTVNCSTGSINVWVPYGRQDYNALLVKFDKRMSKRLSVTASYAYTRQNGINGINNMDNYFETYGTQGARHILNVSGIVDLPWGFQLGFISQSSSRGPFTPVVSGYDTDGDGTTQILLPGTDFTRFDRGIPKEKLAAAVEQFNTLYAGKRDVRNSTIPRVTLPANFSYGDNFSSQDLRLTKKFTFTRRDRDYRFSVFGEMFNVFNIANLSDYNSNVLNGSFGTPQQRQTQVFGSGGPRAVQVGGRFQF